MTERKAHKRTYRRIKIEKELIKDRSLTPIEIAVIFELLTKDSTFKPSQNNLAKILHTSTKTIRDATDKLQAKGYLKIILTPMKQPNIWLFSQTREFLKDNEESTK